MIVLRRFRPTDAPALLSLFRDTIHRVNCRDYTPEQINAWASGEIDVAAWNDRFAGRFVIVAEQANRPVGFAELEDDGHIDRFYVSADHQGQGIGRQLIETLVDEAMRLAIPRLYVEASITAKRFFVANGFAVLAQQSVLCRGVALDNFQMQRTLGRPPTAE